MPGHEPGELLGVEVSGRLDEVEHRPARREAQDERVVARVQVEVDEQRPQALAAEAHGEVGRDHGLAGSALRREHGEDVGVAAQAGCAGQGVRGDRRGPAGAGGAGLRRGHAERLGRLRQAEDVVDAEVHGLLEPPAGVVVGQGDDARPVRVGERGAQLRGQAVAVGREVPHEHLGRRLDDLDHPRPLEEVADRGLVGLEGDTDEVGLHRPGSCHFAGMPLLGNAPGSTTGGCFSQVAPCVPASAIQIGLRAAGRGVVGARERVRQVRHLALGQAQQHRALGRRVARLRSGGRRHVQHQRARGEDVRLDLVRVEHVARHDVDAVAGVDVAAHAGVRVDGQAERALVPGEPGGDARLVADAGAAGGELVAVEHGLGEDQPAGRVQVGVRAGHEIGAAHGAVGEVAVGCGGIDRGAGMDVVGDDDDADGVAGRPGGVLHMLRVEHERDRRCEREDDRDDDVSAQRRRCHLGCSFPRAVRAAMTQPGEAGITEFGESCNGTHRRRQCKALSRSRGVPQGFGTPGRRERRPTLVVAEKRLRVQFLEGTLTARTEPLTSRA